mmetsp:Transcript_52373/g.121854  ORF Transcript_52373/g.121854 Transcript_52373/m.121854 type:complete len:84 (+) Transcript_52373:736-987(+)
MPGSWQHCEVMEHGTAVVLVDAPLGVSGAHAGGGDGDGLLPMLWMAKSYILTLSPHLSGKSTGQGPRPSAPWPSNHNMSDAFQ